MLRRSDTLVTGMSDTDTDATKGPPADTDPRERQLDEDLAEMDRGEGEQPDEELATLPAPRPARRRNPIFMVAVLLLSVLFLWWIRLEIVYFFMPSTPIELGDAMEIEPDELPANRYVTIEAWPNPTRVVKFTQRLRGGTFRMFPVVGQKKLFIQTHTTDEEEEQTEGEESSLELGSTYTGRLLRFGQLGTSVTRSGYQNVRTFFREKLFVDITDDTWLLMDGMAPRGAWNCVVFGFALVILAVGVINAVMLVRTLLGGGGRRPSRR
jgi:hypothetical protein